MKELEIEPFAVQLQISMPVAMSGGQWQRMLGTFVEDIAKACDQSGSSVIGHIKGLATFDDNTYLKVSVVDSEHPADVTGEPPTITAVGVFNLNVLVYGITKTSIRKIVQREFDSLQTKNG